MYEINFVLDKIFENVFWVVNQSSFTLVNTFIRNYSIIEVC